MASAMLMAAGVAAAALAGRALLRQARGGAGMGSVFQQFTGASSVGGAMKGFDEPMGRAEAAKILGIGASSSKEEINKVHRKLMILNHPDRGGSPYLAAKVNEAKQVLSGTNQHSSPFRYPGTFSDKFCAGSLVAPGASRVLLGPEPKRGFGF